MSFSPTHPQLLAGHLQCKVDVPVERSTAGTGARQQQHAASSRLPCHLASPRLASSHLSSIIRYLCVLLETRLPPPALSRLVLRQLASNELFKPIVISHRSRAILYDGGPREREHWLPAALAPVCSSSLASQSQSIQWGPGRAISPSHDFEVPYPHRWPQRFQTPELVHISGPELHSGDFPWLPEPQPTSIMGSTTDTCPL